jgi:hypothetical protein
MFPYESAPVSGGPGLAVDATGVYWMTGRVVRAVRLAGGTATALATAYGPPSLAVDAGWVYFGTFEGDGGGTIARASIDTAPVTVATLSLAPSGIAASSGTVYVGTFDKQVVEAPSGGGTPRSIAPTSTAATVLVVVDAARVYFTDFAEGSIKSVRR